MTLENLLKKINQIIQENPYTREQVIELLSAEPEMTPDEILYLSMAMEYMRNRNQDTRKLEKEFIKRRDKLMKFYK